MHTVLHWRLQKHFQNTEAISADHHGMTIIKNEGILDMIKAPEENNKPTLNDSTDYYFKNYQYYAEDQNCFFSFLFSPCMF